MRKLLISILFSISLTFLSGCLLGSIAQSLPEGPCLIQSLLISNTILPAGVFYETGSRSAYDPPAKVGIEKIGTAFSSEDAGGIVHNIYRFSTDEEAQNEIDQILLYEVEYSNKTQWFSPSITPNINADKFGLTCMQLTENGFRCRFVAKYKVYVSDLYVDLIDLDFEDLKLIIEQLDSSTTSCVS